MRQNRGGFTMVEVVVVLAITAIMASVAVLSLAPWYANYTMSQRQLNAENLYMTLQNGMVNLKADGRLSVLEGVGDAPASYEDEKGSNTACVLLSSGDSEQKAALELVGGSLDSKVSAASFMGFGAIGAYVVELNPISGYVYGVFYSEEEISQSSYHAASLQRNDPEGLAKLKVAYYGGGSLVSFEATDGSSNGYVGYFELEKSGNAYRLSGMHAYRYEDSDGAGGKNLKLNATLSATGSIDKACYGVLVSEKSNPAAVGNPESLLGVVLDDTTLEATDIRVAIPSSTGVASNYLLFKYKGSALASNNSWTPVISGGTYAINANFAAAVKTNGSFSARETYQVRTSSQLQHVGQPLDEDHGTYLGASFLQTHDISLSKAWTPIGVAGEGSKNAAANFTGSYCGAVDEQSIDEGVIAAKPKAPAGDDSAKRFKIKLREGFAFSSIGKTKAAVGAGPSSNAKSYVSGIFGCLEGSLEHVDIETQGDVALLPSGVKSAVSTYNSLAAGSLVGATLPGSKLHDCSLRVRKGALQSSTAIKSGAIFGYYLGGLVGYCGERATGLSVAIDGDAAISFDCAQKGSFGSPSSAVCLGGVVGCESSGLADARLSVDDGGELVFDVESQNERLCIGGLAGCVGGAVSNCDLVDEGNVSIKATPAKNKGAAYAGGVIGLLEEDAKASSCAVGKGARLGVELKSTGQIASYAGGFSGYLAEDGEAASITCDVAGRLDLESACGSAAAYSGGVIAALGKDAVGEDLAFKAKGAKASMASVSNRVAAASGLVAGYLDEGAKLASAKASVKEQSKVLANAQWLNGSATITTGKNFAAVGGIAGYMNQSTVASPRLELSGESTLALGEKELKPTFAGGIVGFHNRGTIAMDGNEKVIRVSCDSGDDCGKEHVDLYAVNNVDLVCGGKEFKLLDYECGKHNDVSKHFAGTLVAPTTIVKLNDYMHLYPRGSK